jgi:hypothetical protein
MATGLRREMFSPEYQQAAAIKQLVERFNKGDLDYLPNKDKEQIAMIAAQFGEDFDVKSKPVRKALFDLIDTAAFGLVPNKWRPKSIGEEYHGESGVDKFAGGLGTVGGLVAGLYTGGTALRALGATGKAATAGVGGMLGRTGTKAADLSSRAGGYLGDVTGRISGAVGANPYVQRGVSAVNPYYQGTVSRGSDFLSRGSEYLGPQATSLWNMTSEAGNRARSVILNNRFFNKP